MARPLAVQAVLQRSRQQRQLSQRQRKGRERTVAVKAVERIVARRELLRVAVACLQIPTLAQRKVIGETGLPFVAAAAVGAVFVAVIGGGALSRGALGFSRGSIVIEIIVLVAVAAALVVACGEHQFYVVAPWQSLQ